MKVNPISIANQSKNVLKKATFALLAGASLTACTPIPTNVKEAFSDKTKADYDLFVKECRESNLQEKGIQAKLDSMCYRDFLNKAVSADNFNIKEEFDRTAFLNVRFYNVNDMERMLRKDLPKEDYKKILDESQSYGLISLDYFFDVAKLQHKYDSVVYKELFERNGILNEENIKDFEAVVQKTNPNQNKDFLTDRK